MKPKIRHYRHFLEDMHLSMKRIEEYIAGKDFDSFKKNYMAVDAVIRNFEVIGEAAKNVPDEVKLKYKQIPWKKMYGLRNLVTHEYFGVDYEIIWKIATKDLPGNKEDLETILLLENK